MSFMCHFACGFHRFQAPTQPPNHPPAPFPPTFHPGGGGSPFATMMPLVPASQIEPFLCGSCVCALFLKSRARVWCILRITPPPPPPLPPRHPPPPPPTSLCAVARDWEECKLSRNRRLDRPVVATAMPAPPLKALAAYSIHLACTYFFYVQQQHVGRFPARVLESY